MSPVLAVPGTGRGPRAWRAALGLLAALALDPDGLAALLAPDGTIALAWFPPVVHTLRLAWAVVAVGSLVRHEAALPWRRRHVVVSGLLLLLGLTGRGVWLETHPWERVGLAPARRLELLNAANPRLRTPDPELMAKSLAERTAELSLLEALRERRRLAVRLVELGDATASDHVERLLAQVDELGRPWDEELRHDLVRLRREARRATWEPGERREPPPAGTTLWMRDVGGPSGVEREGLAGGAVLDDFDGDGDLDLFASSMELWDPLGFWRREDGRFHEAAESAGLFGEWGGADLAQADVDDDGDVDLFVARGAWMGEHGVYPNSLLSNDGSARFTNTTEEAGLLTFRPSSVAAFADVDRDGRLDLFVGNEARRGEDFASELHRNRGEGRFSNVMATSGLEAEARVKGAAFADVDLDGWPDLLVTCRERGARLWRNASAPGRPRFREVTRAARLDRLHPGHACVFGDIDNDGDPDLFVGGFRGREADGGARTAGPRLYENRGDGTFLDRTRGMGLAGLASSVGAGFVDLDGDGWLDLYVGTGGTGLLDRLPNRLFRNVGGERFEDVSAAAGFGRLDKGQAAAFGDVDGDGDEDAYLVLGGWLPADRARDVLLENTTPDRSGLTLRLVGTTSNRSALGARVTVRLRTPEGSRRIERTVGQDSSLGSGSLQLEVGLGQDAWLEDVRVLWPSGLLQVLRGLPLGSVVEVTEGVAEWRRVDPLD